MRIIKLYLILMKWFKHETDAHMNLKLQSVIDRYGLAGYGYYWSCVELVAKEGENYRIKSEKDWKIYFKKFLNLEIEMQDTFLLFFAEKDLIEKKALNKGDLYIPKLEDRQDDYTNKVRRKSVQDTDNIPLEENRKEEKRIDKNIYGEFKKVLLSSEEYEKLIEKIGEKNTEILITELDTYIASKGKKYSSHYATILTWARSRVKQHQEKVESKKSSVAFK